MSLSLIMAVSKHEGVIGNNGLIPWHLRTDMRRFKELTIGHVVIMGRKTWQSLDPRVQPLPGRGNVVFTLDRTFVAPGALVLHDPDGAVRVFEHVADEIFVIGGAFMYRLFLPFATTVYLTEVDAKVQGDTHFAYQELLRPEEWRVITHERVDADEHNEYPSTFRHYARWRDVPITS